MSTEETKAVLESHLKAVFENPSAIVDDYADDAVFITEHGAVKGKAAIGEFTANLIASLPPEMFASFEMLAQEIEGDIAYIAWTAKPLCPIASDTFVVRNGKIVAQTATIYMPS